MKKLLHLILLMVLACIITSCNSKTYLELRSWYLFKQVEKLTEWNIESDYYLSDAVNLNAFDPKFVYLLQDAYELERQLFESDKAGYQIGYEFFCYWLRGQDELPDDGLEGIHVENIYDNFVDIRITYKNMGKIENHSMLLSKEKGKWVIRDFDNRFAELKSSVDSIKEKQNNQKLFYYYYAF